MIDYSLYRTLEIRYRHCRLQHCFHAVSHSFAAVIVLRFGATLHLSILYNLPCYCLSLLLTPWFDLPCLCHCLRCDLPCLLLMEFCPGLSLLSCPDAFQVHTGFRVQGVQVRTYLV